MNLSLNSHSRNKSKQDSVAPSRRRRSGAIVQTTSSRAFSGKSQFQQPEGHSVVWTVRDQMNARSFGNVYDSFEFLHIFRWGRVFFLGGKKKSLPGSLKKELWVAAYRRGLDRRWYDMRTFPERCLMQRITWPLRDSQHFVLIGARGLHTAHVISTWGLKCPHGAWSTLPVKNPSFWRESWHVRSGI